MAHPRIAAFGALLGSIGLAGSGCEPRVDFDGSATGGGDTGGAGGRGGAGLPEAPQVSWSECTGDDVPGFVCADVSVPLDWAAPDGEQATVRLRRMQAAVDPPRGAIWMLEGGPGAPGRWMTSFGARTAAAHPDLDVMVVDHRGTGDSGELACDPPTDPPTPACLASISQEQGAWIAATSATASARDVAALARWFGRGDVQLLYGRSYGTYWAHRVVSLDPGAFDAVVLDSPCDAVVGCPSSRRDREADQVGRAFLSLCDVDPACAARMPGGAVSFAEAVVAAADAESCAGAAAAGLTGERMRLALARMIGSPDRALAPALLVRYARCSAADVDALTNVVAYLAVLESVLTAVPDFSLPTNYHVMRSEFWDEDFSVANAEAQLASTIAASGASLRWARAFEGWPWPIVEVDPGLHAWRFSDAPVLVITGGLDSATPVHLLQALPGSLPPGSTFVRQELAGHVASASDSPLGQCARDILDAFLDAPGAALELGCVAEADIAERAVLFEAGAASALTWFGTSSAYD